jgi:hypothetical protein
VACAAAAVKAGMDLCLFLLLGDRVSARWAFLGPFRDLLATGMWFSAFFSRNVEWRGRTLRISGGSRLVPVGEMPVLEPEAEGAAG